MFVQEPCGCQRLQLLVAAYTSGPGTSSAGCPIPCKPDLPNQLKDVSVPTDMLHLRIPAA
jgi:hypothetical protein